MVKNIQRKLLSKCFMWKEMHSLLRQRDAQNSFVGIAEKSPQGPFNQVHFAVTLAPQTVWRALAGWQYRTTAVRSTSTEPHWSLSAAPRWELLGAAHVNPARSVSSVTNALVKYWLHGYKCFELNPLKFGANLSVLNVFQLNSAWEKIISF